MFEYLVFNEIKTFTEDREIRIEVDGDKLRYCLKDNSLYVPGLPESRNRSGVYTGDADAFIRRLEAFDVPSWKEEFFQPDLDGYGWKLRYKEVGKPCRKIMGSNDCPDCYTEFIGHLLSITREETGMLDYLRYTESENGVLFRKYEMRVRDGKIFYKFTGPYFSDEELGEHVFDGDVSSYIRKLVHLGFREWSMPFADVPMLDGIDWILEYKFSEDIARMISGSNEGPENIQEFIFALNPANVMDGHAEI